ncbi:hypothetical protein JAAARDRAFT_509821, partial [Jaapia argillacea MUCL 33604]
MGPSKSTSEGLARLERKMNKHIKIIGDLRCQWNASIPISVLAPELLAKVFTFCEAQEHGVGTTRDTVRPRDLWFKVTHVCRYWRETAIRCPTLWSRILCDIPSWATLSLHRSLQAPITVDCAHISTKTVEVLTAALQLTDRLKRISLEASSTDLESLSAMLDTLSSQEFTILEKIDLTCISPMELAVLGVTDTFIFPPDLFFHTPRLRSFEIHNLTVIWDHPLLHTTQLTHLKIQHTPSPPTMTQLLDVLESFPTLESLDLTSSLPKLPRTAKPTYPPARVVYLHHLSSLEICGPVFDCVQFTYQLAVPPTTTLRLVWELSCRTDISCVAEHPIIQTLGGPAPVIKHASFAHATEPTALLISASRIYVIGSTIPLDVPSITTARFRIGIQWTGWFQSPLMIHITAAMRTVFRVMGTRELDSILFGPIPTFSEEEWLVLSDTLKTVVAVYACDDSVAGLVSALSFKGEGAESASGRAAQSSQPKSKGKRTHRINPADVFMPNLGRLSLTTIDFQAAKTGSTT